MLASLSPSSSSSSSCRVTCSWTSPRPSSSASTTVGVASSAAVDGDVATASAVFFSSSSSSWSAADLDSSSSRMSFEDEAGLTGIWDWYQSLVDGGHCLVVIGFYLRSISIATLFLLLVRFSLQIDIKRKKDRQLREPR